jgi:trimethylamine:corrinoid methyltransferase-like protein
LKETRALFRKEQHFPSNVIDRGGPSMDGNPDTLQRARQRVDELLGSYQRHPLQPETEEELIAFAQREGNPAGLEGVPGIICPEFAHEPNLSN